MSSHVADPEKLAPGASTPDYSAGSATPPDNGTKTERAGNPHPQHHEEKEPVHHSPPAPDTGFRAWSQVLAAHCIVFNSWGTVNSFGIFQAYYTTSLQPPPTASMVSWIGSLQICLLFLVATFSGRLYDAGYLRSTLCAGSFLQVFGVCMASLGKTYWQILLAQGICVGLGSGLCFAPVVANTSVWFQKHRALAIGMAAAGGATGGMVFPAIAEQMLPKVGFGWTMRTMALVILVLACVALTLVRTRLPPRKSGPFIERAAFKEAPYSLFACGMFFVMWATYFGYYYVRSFALDELKTSTVTSFDLLLVTNGVGFPARIIPALLADTKLGPVKVLAPTVIINGIIMFCWAGVHSAGGLFAWCVFFGWFGASTQSLFPVACASFSTDLSKNGTRIGMIFTIVSIACLTGPPIAGALINADGGSYLAPQIWAGVCLLLGGSLLTAAEVTKRAKRKEKEEEVEEDEA